MKNNIFRDAATSTTGADLAIGLEHVHCEAKELWQMHGARDAFANVRVFTKADYSLRAESDFDCQKVCQGHKGQSIE